VDGFDFDGVAGFGVGVGIGAPGTNTVGSAGHGPNATLLERFP